MKPTLEQPGMVAEVSDSRKLEAQGLLAETIGSAGRPVTSQTFAAAQPLGTPFVATEGMRSSEGAFAAPPRAMTYTQLCAEAIRLGVTIQNCWRDDENGVCRPCVNVNRNGNDFVWRFHDKTKPKSYLVALNSAMDEARKLWGVTRQPNDRTERPALPTL